MDFGVIFQNTVNALFNAEALILALAAIGLNVHFGYTGLLNFGQVGFAAAGAYGIASGVTYLDLPFGLSLLFGVGLAIVLALLLGIPTLRLRADYLAIVTIASSEVIRLTARSASLRDQTGGSSGLSGFAQGFYDLNPFGPGSYGFGWLTYRSNRFFLLVVGWTLVVLCSALVYLLMRSPWGRVLRGIREDEDAVRSLGKNVVGYKMQSLVLGGLFGAFAGFAFALANSSVQPDNYGTQFTFLAFTAMILGGAGRVVSPVLGAILFQTLLVFIENVLVQAKGAGYIPDAVLSNNDIGAVRFVLVGVFLMALMIFPAAGPARRQEGAGARCPLTPCPLTPCPLTPCPPTPCRLTPCPLSRCPAARYASRRPRRPTRCVLWRRGRACPSPTRSWSPTTSSAASAGSPPWRSSTWRCSAASSPR